MSVVNPPLGAPRIRGELLKLVRQTTVAKYMARRRRPPSQGWKTFLRNHADGIASMDLFLSDDLVSVGVRIPDFAAQPSRAPVAGCHRASEPNIAVVQFANRQNPHCVSMAALGRAKLANSLTHALLTAPQGAPMISVSLIFLFFWRLQGLLQADHSAVSLP